MFITFEGLHSSGKTTQARLLVDHLRVRAHAPVRFIREPGGTVISERLREILLDKKYLELSEASELFLFSASRAQLVRQVIHPALLRGEIVVCDRYYDSTTAYQGYGRGLDLATIRGINTLAAAGVVPDLTVLVDITIEEIEKRKHASKTEFDRMESAGREFFARVHNGYLSMAAEEPKRFVVVDGMRSVDDIAQEIADVVDNRQHLLKKEGQEES